MSLKNMVDEALQRAVAPGGVPGVVAMATDRNGNFYEGAAGVRKLGDSATMSTDTIGLIASMTKAITSTAVMQLVERGKLDLESPAGKWLPELDKVRVLEGFDAAGQPRLRAPKCPVTLKHLLTHTSGFSYEFLSTDLQRYRALRNLPDFTTCTLDSIRFPLLFDPGARWAYGVSIDWLGLIIETVSGQKLHAYLADHVLGPLGMDDTAFITRSGMRPDRRARLAPIHARTPQGLVPTPIELPQSAEHADFDMGGGGLYGTVGDYMKFVRMILNRGAAGGTQILRPETVDAMSRNQIGALNVEDLKSADPRYSNDLPLPPDNPHKWGLGFLINTKPLATGRAAGSLMWAGIANSYYWIDPTNGIGGVLLTQILPFADVKALPLFMEFETAVYQHR